MADFQARIKPKRSTVTGEVPTSADLEVGEIALSTADGKIFTKHTDGSIKEISGSGGGGGGAANKIEEIENVEPRKFFSTPYDWSTNQDTSVTGGFSYDETTDILTLNKETTGGLDIRTNIVGVPANGTLYFTTEGDKPAPSVSEIPYSNLTIKPDTTIQLQAELSITANTSAIWFDFNDPYYEGPSFNNDILVYDSGSGVWRPSEYLLENANDVNNDSKTEDRQSLVWDLKNKEWVPGYPKLSSPEGSESLPEITGLIGPAINGMAGGEFGFTAEGPTGDDSAGAIAVPADFVGIKFLGQAMPSTIYAGTNGNIHWDSALGGDNTGRSGNFIVDSGNYDFWLAHWSQDTKVISMFTRSELNTFTIRAEYGIPYNTNTGVPVETTFYKDGSIRVIYGTNQGSAISISDITQGIASNGVALASGFGANASPTGGFTWSYRGFALGNELSDLKDVSTATATEGQVLRFDGTLYKPTSMDIQDMDDFELNPLTAAGVGGVRVKILPTDTVDNSNGFSQEGTNFIIDHVNATGLDEYQNGGWVSQIAPGGQIVVVDSQGNQSTTLVVNSPTVDTSSQYGPRTYFLVDSTFQAAMAALPNGEEVTIGLDGPYTLSNARAPLAEGDILQWVAADKKFKPAQQTGTVQSVNSQIGDVQVDVEDLNNFALVAGVPISNNDVLAYNAIDQKWKPLSLASPRYAQTLETGTLSSTNYQQLIFVEAGTAGVFSNIQVNKPCVVTIYASLSAYAFDEGRDPFSVSPVAGDGVILEVAFNAAGDQLITPTVNYFTSEAGQPLRARVINTATMPAAIQVTIAGMRFGKT